MNENIQFRALLVFCALPLALNISERPQNDPKTTERRGSPGARPSGSARSAGSGGAHRRRGGGPASAPSSPCAAGPSGDARGRATSAACIDVWLPLVTTGSTWFCRLDPRVFFFATVHSRIDPPVFSSANCSYLSRGPGVWGPKMGLGSELSKEKDLIQTSSFKKLRYFLPNAQKNRFSRHPPTKIPGPCMLNHSY